MDCCFLHNHFCHHQPFCHFSKHSRPFRNSRRANADISAQPSIFCHYNYFCRRSASADFYFNNRHNRFQHHHQHTRKHNGCCRFGVFGISPVYITFSPPFTSYYCRYSPKERRRNHKREQSDMSRRSNRSTTQCIRELIARGLSLYRMEVSLWCCQAVRHGRLSGRSIG